MPKGKRRSRFHGVTSLCLMFAALAIGVVATSRHSWLFAGIGIGVSLLWVLPVAWFFCSKCCCRLDCGHVLFGLVTRLLPKREPGPYTKLEALFTLVPILVAVGYPQYWLSKEIALLAVFWGLAVVAGLEAMLFVCRDCSNTACPFSKSKG
jgi:hypothetical protein